MLADGVPPAMIENVARMAGMPVGPLSLNDEVARRSRLENPQGDRGRSRRRRPSTRGRRRLLEEMVEKRGRYGRKNGKGFYDYPEKAPKQLWPGLADLQKKKLDPDTISVEELKQRLLGIMALETARCFEEKVLTDVREADVGSILGFGFAPYSGGTLSYIDMMGTKKFVETVQEAREEIRRALQAEQAADRHGGEGRNAFTENSRRQRRTRRRSER